MKSKMTTVFAALMIALMAVGFAYATWSQTLYINGTVNTGTLCVGIRDEGTNDPPGTLDPGWDERTYKQVQYDKDVASCTSENIDYKCTHNKTDYYEKVRITIKNAYPSYAPEINISVANCGTIPVKPSKIDIITWNDPAGLFDDMDLVYYKIMLCGKLIAEKTDSKEYNFTWADFKKDLGVPQIDPCHVLTITIKVHFLETAPENATLTFDIAVTFSQWNKAS